MQETQVWSLGREDPLEKGMATHSSILAWRIPMDRGAWQATVQGVAESSITEWLTFTFFKGGRGLTGIKRQDNKKKNLGYISPECGSSLGRRRREAKKNCSDVLRSSWVTELIILWEVGGVGGHRMSGRRTKHHRNVVGSTHAEVTCRPEVLSPVLWQHILVPAAAKIWYRALAAPGSEAPLPTSSACLHHQPSLQGLFPFSHRGPSKTIHSAPSPPRPWPSPNHLAWREERARAP